MVTRVGDYSAWRTSACGCTVDDGSLKLLSDRYAIRTRNLQDWNPTRHRCANRSKASAHEDAAAVRLVDDDAPEALAALQDMDRLVRFLDALQRVADEVVDR